MIRGLFTAGEPVDFHGEYYRLERAPLAPGCFQQPHVPIMVGGNGERRTIRTAARYADIYNYNGWAGMDVEVFKHKRSVLARHCDDIGSRNFHIDLVGEFAEAGVVEMCCATQDRVEDLQQVDEEIIAAFDS